MSNYLFSIFPSENFIDLGLYQYGWEQCDPAHSFGPASRAHYLFHYVISGTGTLFAENSRKESVEYHIKSGQGFLIFPHQICTYMADEKLPWEYVWLEFDGLKAKEALESIGLSKDTPIYRPRYKDIAQQMMNEMLYIARHSQDSSFSLIGHLFLFLDALARSSSPAVSLQGNRMRDFYIKEALVFIEQNFQNDITVEDIAAFCGLNRSYFGKIFRDTVGKSPQDFLISYRMSKAGELLKLTSLSIADVGNAVGYPNQLHFSRAFKNAYGVSPRNWRYKQSRQGADVPSKGD